MMLKEKRRRGQWKHWFALLYDWNMDMVLMLPFPPLSFADNSSALCDASGCDSAFHNWKMTDWRPSYVISYSLLLWFEDSALQTILEIACMPLLLVPLTSFTPKKNWKAASLLKKWIHQKWFLVSSSKRRFHWFLGLKRSQRNQKATLGPDGNRCQPVCCVNTDAHLHQQSTRASPQNPQGPLERSQTVAARTSDGARKQKHWKGAAGDTARRPEKTNHRPSNLKTPAGL